ncbi:hypothetical protein TCAL_12931 [Tigriopus californicus]|uniref:Ionotropic glutamate receptor C-terminal domain-containing protein n=1 Tax=Tigriopus californicus TaxID=6832 RepID=A0A553PLA9_TIGCA|nr:hypothetical protein TCAL_12931 [Tigriopus californicus]
MAYDSFDKEAQSEEDSSNHLSRAIQCEDRFDTNYTILNIIKVREITQIPGLEHPVLRKIGTFITDTTTIHPSNPFTWNRDHFFARRKDLRGITLGFLVEESKPYCFIPEGSNSTHLQPYGIFIDMLKLFSTEFNFTIKFERAPKSSWTEMIRLLTLNKFDGTGVDVAINKERAQVVDFTSPIFWSDYRLVSQAPNQALSFTTYSSTFSFHFWLAFIANIVICSFALYVTIRIERSQRWKLWECFSMVCLAMVCIGLSHLPSRISSRVLFLSVLLLGTVIWASYQASLTSTLTVVQSAKTISDLNDVLQLDFEIGLWSGTVVEQVMKLSPDNSVAKTLYETKIKNNPKNQLNNENGFERVRLDSKFAYLTVTTETIYNPYYPCDVVQSHISTFKFPSGMAFRPGFELLPLFNHYLAKLMQSGQYERIRLQHLPRPNSCSPKDLTLGFDNIISAFILLAGGVLAALVLAGSERVRMLLASKGKRSNDLNSFLTPRLK